MGLSLEDLKSRIADRFGARLTGMHESVGQLTVELAAPDLPVMAAMLRDDPGLRFEQLVDLCGIDYDTYGRSDWETHAASAGGFSRGVAVGSGTRASADRPRFAVVYHLLSVTHNQRLRVRAWVDGDPPVIGSVCEIWNSANWYEREAFDLFGILFEGHPDLRRLLTDYGFIGHPFRKDFPLEGNVEVRYDPEQGRVIYQPVSIENRIGVPRVVRTDDRYESARRKGGGGDA